MQYVSVLECDVLSTYNADLAMGNQMNQNIFNMSTRALDVLLQITFNVYAS